ncbi:class I SAM-dependent methyltransferase [Microbulbifer thermotolerans]|uniref:Class I SAM-dependent methyltransferase n=1 Tax=Microbulbifer thermotolerans TaxID=252514 RepID=A0A143HM06_MICTH|nr:class I SAM-dependent methyltransferase [Microbulbifer thermotolerans]AMX02729.1 methyl-transferase [Microbulbifer thermotolerans]MCX2779583.1 class I SAM-dependent methyltransferase [Microbulbifer thermotolerans]MCX2794561.1 class I SAM-dependent methyltransferase [Microbulbifer thermotolerans]MCX2801388.1 class I SAM-dependent methyltransferase [Microbulbifer thermotolerans]MCX2804986.1 class I SAM-dependent methyltransferase [Microbulbifer thermotolerans]
MTKKSYSRGRAEIPPFAKSCAAVAHWFTSPLGQEILSQQLALAQPFVERMFGYHLMQAGVTSAVDFSACSRINHRFRLSGCAGQEGAALVEFEQLPLPSESIDVVLLHHLLDFAQQPHQVLREAARVLIPGGHLLLIGFNPFSLLGLSRLLFARSAYQRGNQLRAARIADWMHLLDLQASTLERGFFRLPLQQRDLLAKTSWMERLGARWHLPWGGFYIIVARKEVARMRAIKINWRGEQKPSLTAVPSSSRVAARRHHRKR